MAGKDIIEMSQRELRRLHVIRKAIEGILKQKEAGELLSLRRSASKEADQESKA